MLHITRTVNIAQTPRLYVVLLVKLIIRGQLSNVRLLLVIKESMAQIDKQFKELKTRVGLTTELLDVSEVSTV